LIWSNSLQGELTLLLKCNQTPNFREERNSPIKTSTLKSIRYFKVNIWVKVIIRWLYSLW